MSAIGYPFSAGSNIGINANAGVAVGPTVANGQSFQTIPLPNTQIALYTISICDPTTGQSVLTWTFPISPKNITQTFSSLTNIYDVAGPSSTYGVTRVVDMYGNTPVTYRIEGTTGWQRHSTDGFQSTGMQSIAAIQSALNQFAAYNANQQLSNNSNLYTMRFYDYFSGQFWQVVPMGPQVIRQDDQKPLLFFYSFNLVGVANLSDPIQDTTNDPVQSALSVSSSQAISNLSSSLTSTLTGYEDETAGALGEVATA